jgi:FecR protein
VYNSRQFLVSIRKTRFQRHAVFERIEMRHWNKLRIRFHLLPACGLALFLSLWTGAAVGQNRKPSFPNLPFPKPGSNSGVGQQLAEAGLSRALNDQLPLKLDANAIYPTVAAPPGGPFVPRPLAVTAANIDQPLPPGDYAINMVAFCTEYSVHRPGAGIAYRLGPLQGRAAGAIGALLWRGTIQKGKSPQQLQAVSWAIQSGLRYAQMPKTYQAVIDEVIPDHKNELNGDFMQSTEDSYAAYAKTAKLPPLEQMLAKMGKPGELALSARKQRDALLRQNTSDQIKEQTLFAGQEAGVYTPVKAEEGPWSERIPGVAYLRYQIVGGNMAGNNIMQIRIVGQGGAVARRNLTPRLVYASFAAGPVPETPAISSVTPQALFGNSIGCAVGQGAQCLIPVPTLSQPPANQGQSIAKATQLKGKVTITHNGVMVPLTANTPIYMGDTITTDAGSQAFISFVDNTQMTLSESTKLKIDDYVFDPQGNHYSAAYLWMEGAFKYVSGLITKPKTSDTRIETSYGTIGIRGTEFIARKDSPSAASIGLIHGSLDIPVLGATAPMTVTGPVMISFDDSGTGTSRLTQAQYDAMQTQLSSGAASVAGGRVIPMPPKKGR